VYGYEEDTMMTASWRPQLLQSSPYVTPYVDDNGNFMLLTNARLAMYILETGQSALNVTVPFSCSGTDDGMREYILSIPVTQ
jgi:hypothetical protein